MSQASRKEAGTAGYTGSACITEVSKSQGFYPSQGCPALLLMICSAGKQIYKCFAGHIRLPFMSILLNTHLLQSSLPHCVFGTSSHAYIPKFTILLWLAGERETFPCRGGVRGKMCAQGDAKSFRQVLCVLTDFAEGFCSDLSQTWYWQMPCKLPTQHWQCLSDLTRDHCPSLTPLPSPLSAQASVYLERRELSLPDCVVVL